MLKNHKKLGQIVQRDNVIFQTGSMSPIAFAQDLETRLLNGLELTSTNETTV